jgi:hypothetical protein
MAIWLWPLAGSGHKIRYLSRISTKIAPLFFTGSKGDIGCDHKETKFMERTAKPEERDLPSPCTVEAILFDFGGVIAEEGFRNGLVAIAQASGLPMNWFTTWATS